MLVRILLPKVNPTIVGRLIRGDGLVLGRFVPEPWPTTPSVPKKQNTKSKAPVAQEAA